MVAIINNARFNRSALLGELADEAYRVDHPGRDYVAAAKLVWNAMRNQAIYYLEEKPGRDSSKLAGHMEGDKNRPGMFIRGMGPVQALNLLWPTLTTKEMYQAQSSVTRTLRISSNAICLRQGRRNGLSEWWVADEWIEPPIQRKRAVARKFHDVSSTPVQSIAKKVAPSNDKKVAPSNDDKVVQIDVRDARTAEEVSDMVRNIIREMGTENALLRKENEQLKQRIDNINKALKGL